MDSVEFGWIRLDSVGFGQSGWIQSDSVGFGRIQSDSVRFGRNGRIRSDLVEFVGPYIYRISHFRFPEVSGQLNVDEHTMVNNTTNHNGLIRMDHVAEMLQHETMTFFAILVMLCEYMKR